MSRKKPRTVLPTPSPEKPIEQEKAPLFNRYSVVLTVVLAIVALLFGLIPLALHFNWFGVNNPSLKPDSSSSGLGFRPPGIGLPTTVSFSNDRPGEGRIDVIEFIIDHIGPTPNRDPNFGKGPTIAVDLTLNNLSRDKSTFTKRLAKPAIIPGGGEISSIQLAIVEPALSGKSYKGTVVVHYNAAEPLRIPDVELDVLVESPQSADE